jgi:iron complex transport system substrate-binding protein
MPRGWRALAAALVAACTATAAAAAPPVPRRVASLNLAADEVLVEILPPDRLVAVTSFADERGTSNVVGRVPPGVARFPKADLERLVALAPDMVVVSEYTDADVLRLIETSGIRVYRMQGLQTLAGYRQAVLDLGRAVGADAAAGRVVQRYDDVLSRLRARLAGAPRPRVLYWADGMTAGAGTAIGSLVETAGGTNVAAAAGVTGIAPIGAERAFALDPDVVLIGVWPGTREALTGHPLLRQMRAVKGGRIVEMPTELLVALSQYAADAAWDLGHRLHPDRVPARP